MSCLICKKYLTTNLNPHNPKTLCLMFHGINGESGYTNISKIPFIYSDKLISDVNYQSDLFKSYVKSFHKVFTDEGMKNLYLYSEITGVGKTFTASAILNEFNVFFFLTKYKNGEKIIDLPSYFLDVTELQEIYNKFNRSNIDKGVALEASKEYYKRLELASKAILVCFDDLGVRECTEAFRGDLHKVINHRSVNKLTSIYTSNFTIDNLIKIYDKRIYDRVRDKTAIISFSEVNKSYRKEL